jgi:DNA-directed RNA polymerase specialized sigma24 family protein
MPSPHHTDSPNHAPRTTESAERPADGTSRPSHGRRAALATFYTAHQRSLSAAVHGRARWADDAIVADACAYAWLQLVRRTDVTLDRRGLSWLKLVATQEAWRLNGPSNDRPVGLFIAEPDDEAEFFEPASLHGDPLVRVLDRETQHERLERFAQLKPRERRDLFLHAAGYSYTEIAALTDSTYTAVNRRLTEGRRRLLKP